MQNLLLCYGSISTENAITSGSYNTSFTSTKDSQTSAGSTPLDNSGTSETMGLAVFKGDTLIGELTARETLCHMLIQNDIESCNITIPRPDNTNENIDLYLYNNSHPRIKVDIINGTPFIRIDLKLEARILSVSSSESYTTEEDLSQISLSASQHIESIMTEYLYKTSVKLNSDIDSFGNHALSIFLTNSEFESYNWLENYKNATFNVNVNTRVKSAFLLGSGK